MARPFIKWAGGKTQLLPELMQRIPQAFGRYHEPFVGSAALFFHLNERALLHGAVLSDANPALVEMYVVVRDQIDPLLTELQVHALHATDRDYFYAVRNWDRCADWADRSAVERAARMIFLNKTCFNGLHRVNRRGHFNVPFGSYRNPTVVDANNLRAASRALGGVEIVASGFQAVLDRAAPGDLVYFDPPYVPLSPTASFTAYTHDVFGPEQHQHLAEVFAELTDRGVHVLLSNSYTPLVHELYARFRVDAVRARRAINRDATKRGTVREVIVLSSPANRAPRTEGMGT